MLTLFEIRRTCRISTIRTCVQATRAFAGIGAFTDATMNVSEDRRAAERFRGTYVSANTFKLVDRHPLVGRAFLPEDDQFDLCLRG